MSWIQTVTSWHDARQGSQNNWYFDVCSSDPNVDKRLFPWIISTYHNLSSPRIHSKSSGWSHGDAIEDFDPQACLKSNSNQKQQATVHMGTDFLKCLWERHISSAPPFRPFPFPISHLGDLGIAASSPRCERSPAATSFSIHEDLQTGALLISKHVFFFKNCF